MNIKEKLQFVLIIAVFVACVLICIFGAEAIFERFGAVSEEAVERSGVIGGWIGVVVGYCVCKVLFGKEEK